MILFLTILGFCSAVSLIVYGVGEVVQGNKVSRGLTLNPEGQTEEFERHHLKIWLGFPGTFLLENFLSMFQYFHVQISYFKSHFPLIRVHISC